MLSKLHNDTALCLQHFPVVPPLDNKKNNQSELYKTAGKTVLLNGVFGIHLQIMTKKNSKIFIVRVVKTKLIGLTKTIQGK